MHTRTHLLPAIISLAILTYSSVACQKTDQPAQVETAQSHHTDKTTRIIVPDYVKKSWKAVRISITDKSSSKESTYTIPIGATFKIPNSDMNIEVESFLPSFIMEGTTMTSSSNELNNPSVRVKITESAKIIYQGWLFSLYPTSHAFMHPIYGFTLVDVVPVKYGK